MAAQRLEVEARSAAPPDVVFELLADATTWQDWAGLTVPRSRWEREGVPAPGGVGAVRRLGRGPFGASEEILAYDPPHRLSYTVLSGLPVRRYRADVELEPDGDGTRIRWRAAFEPTVPGTGALLRRFLTATLGSFARRLAAYAATRSAGLG